MASAADVRESFLDEMKRYVHFGPDDGAALRELSSIAENHFPEIAENFHDEIERHPEARAVITGGREQIERLKGTLRDWLALQFTGPWDEAYYEKRMRIGRMHVRIALPQRYMFAAMSLIEVSLVRIAQRAYPDDEPRRVRAVWAVSRICEIELAIMLESYREAFGGRILVDSQPGRTLFTVLVPRT